MQNQMLWMDRSVHQLRQFESSSAAGGIATVGASKSGWSGATGPGRDQGRGQLMRHTRACSYGCQRTRYLRAQEFRDVVWLLGLYRLAPQFPLQLPHTVLRAAQLMQFARFADYLFQIVFHHGSSCLSVPELLAASDRPMLNAASMGYWSALLMPKNPELRWTVRVAKS